jgi:aminoglycoside phosphotransferase
VHTLCVPPASGIHLPWESVPTEIKQWVVDVLGSEILEANDLSGGFSPGSCTCLRAASGQQVFVKAVGTALNPESPFMHRREARVASRLPLCPQVPRLIAQSDDGDWAVLIFEKVDGRAPSEPWIDTELDLVLRHLAALHEMLTPCPVPEIETTATYFSAMFTGWRSLAAAVSVSPLLDEWSRRHLEHLADLESRWNDAALGETLVHGDIRSDNVLLTESSVAFVDWPHASKGQSVFDVVAWAPSVTLEGGPEPEELLRRYPRRGELESERIDAIATAVAGFFTYHATLPPPPGLPTLRAFQEAQGTVARRWIRQRLALP